MPEIRTITFHDRPCSVYRVAGTDLVAYSWARCERGGSSLGNRADPDPEHEHTIDCLWVWHLCSYGVAEKNPKADPDFLARKRNTWKPSGVGAHTLHARNPLHLEASLIWPECCGLHGWIRDGSWVEA